MGKPPGPVLRAFSMLLGMVLLAMGAGMGYFAAGQLSRAVGGSGQTGTFIATACHTVGSGRASHEDCTGLFQPASGPARWVISDDGVSHSVGARIPARSDGDNQVTPTGPGETVSSVGEVLLCLFFLASGVLVFAAAVRPPSPAWVAHGRGRYLTGWVGKAFGAMPLVAIALMIIGGALLP